MEARGTEATVSVALLGELRIRIDDVELPRLSPKSRALVASLALRCGEVVSVDRLSDELWPSMLPDRAKRVVQVRVAEIRKVLSVAMATSLLESVAPGYRLAVEPVAVDANRFCELLAAAHRCQRGDDPLGATTKLREALGLWRGAALADAQGSRFLEAEAVRLDELRLGAIEDRIDAELVDGCHQRLVGELHALVAMHPLRERLWGQLATALYRSERQTDALRACAAARRRLAEDVGLEPGPPLRAVEHAVLAHDPALTWRPQSPSARSVIPDPRPVDPADVQPPPVRYVKTPSGVSVAYQVAGDGPIDLVIVPGYISELDNWWEAWSGRLVRRLCSFARLILFDKRGMGLSDRPEHITIDDWVDDVLTVLDAVGSARPAILGMSGGGAIAVLFAAIHPERTGPLVIYTATPRILTDGTSYPVKRTAEEMESRIAALEATWGTGSSIAHWCPSVADDPRIRAQFGQYERRSASPGSASAYLRLLASIDVRGVLPLVASPTLVIHPARDRAIPIEVGRYIADHIPGAVMCELDTEDHLIWFSEKVDEITEQVERFVTSRWSVAPPDRSLTTVVAVLVDGDGRAVLDRWRQLVLRHGGLPTGGHLVARFDRPGGAVECAVALVAQLSSLGSAPRVGVHAGQAGSTETPSFRSVAAEASRVAAMARPGEVLRSSMVRELVASWTRAS